MSTTNKCNVFYLTKKEAKTLGFKADSYDNDGVDQKWAAKLTANISLFPSIRRGDVVSVFPDSERYRNDGLFVYDGEKIMPLDAESDEYGNIPSTFCIEEFSPQYWSDIICHNQIVWFNPKVHDYRNHTKADENTIIVEEETYKIIIVSEEDVDEFFDSVKNSSETVMIAYHHEDVVEMIDLDNSRYTREFDSPKKTFIVMNM